MKFTCKRFFVFTAMFAFTYGLQARDHLIYSVVEDLPMGEENEVLRRNYYVNIGSNQGITPGTVLSVYRVISKSNPYDNKKRINYNIPIGQLEVIHTEEQASVAKVKKLNSSIKDPIFEINNFMIGDQVTVYVK